METFSTGTDIQKLNGIMLENKAISFSWPCEKVRKIPNSF